MYDGASYKKMSCAGMPLPNPDNLSYSFNTDGIAYGKSSHQQIWPIFLMINELPPRLRVKHMLLASIWVGKSEPDMNVFLQPFVEEANDLYVNGFNWQHGERAVHSVAIPMCYVLDSQARWRALNHTCFSGYKSYTFCEIPGKWIAGYGMRFEMSEDVAPERTDADIKKCMVEATVDSISLQD